MVPPRAAPSTTELENISLFPTMDGMMSLPVGAVPKGPFYTAAGVPYAAAPHLSMLQATSMGSVPAVAVAPPPPPQQQQQGKRKRPAKPAVGIDAPKRAKTAYLIFCDKHRPQVLKELMEQDPDRKCTKADMMHVTTTLAQKWKEVDPAERAECEHDAAVLKAKYEQEKAIYIQECKNKGAVKAKKGAKKDKAAPKKAATAYTLFMQTERPIVATEHPNADFKEVSIMMGKRWRELGEEEKKVYEAKALTAAEQYKRDVEEYKKNKANNTAPTPTH